jgi:hypothetical protein
MEAVDGPCRALSEPSLAARLACSLGALAPLHPAAKKKSTRPIPRAFVVCIIPPYIGRGPYHLGLTCGPFVRSFSAMTDESLAHRMVQVLAANSSSAREGLAALSFDSLVAQPLSTWLADAELTGLLLRALQGDALENVLTRHALPFITRTEARMRAQSERVRDALPEGAEARITQIVSGARGPRFVWLKGALDGADVRELIAPVVQAVLLQFANKLPAAAGLGAQAAAGSALGGFVGLLGKQMQKTARDLAEVGKNVMGGLSGELERRLQNLSRDFTQTAMLEFRTAMLERLQSAEGRAILVRMRERLIRHVLDAPQQELAEDLARAPFNELAAWAPDLAAHVSEQTWFRELLAAEVQALVETIGTRSLRELLEEAGLEAATRALVIRTFDPALRTLFAASSFEAWLERLVQESGGQ